MSGDQIEGDDKIISEVMKRWCRRESEDTVEGENNILSNVLGETVKEEEWRWCRSERERELIS